MKKTLLPAIITTLALPALPAMANIGDLPSQPSQVIITDPVPGAEPEVLVKSGLGFIRLGEQLDVLPSDGSLTKMIRTADKVYLGNIFSWSATTGWIVGDIDGNTVTFELPQLVRDEMADIDGVITPQQYYAVACEMQVRGSSADMVPLPTQTFSFEIAPDGSLTPSDPELFMGNFLFNGRSWEWNMDGDFYTSLSSQTLKAPEAPAGLNFTPMVLTYPHILYGGAYARPVEVALSGADCYIKGMAVKVTDLADSPIHGTLEGKVVSFDSYQYLGNSWLFGFTQYFLGGETAYSSLYPEFTPCNLMEMVYDETTGCYSSDMSFVIVPAEQAEAENLYYENIYASPSILPLATDSKISSLVTPQLNAFTEADTEMPNVIDFVVSMISPDNQLLDMSKLYFEFFMDGAPFEFTPSIDPALRQSASRIPFGTTDYICFVAQEEIVQMVAIPRMDFSDLKMRLVYMDDPENPVYSDFMEIKTSGVEQIGYGHDVTIGYLDLQGRPIPRPDSGMAIRKVRATDGSIRFEKTIMR